jgi:O-6-methylguanine DNA methyltransferase
VKERRTVATPLGLMLAVVEDEELCSLQFVEEEVCLGSCALFQLLQQELDRYFLGQLSTFTIPMRLQGTPFQRQVWQTLCNIPLGQTRLYKEIHSAHRAVGGACRSNPILILVPCHRVVSVSGTCGFCAGIERKQWLLSHEKYRSHFSGSCEGSVKV